MYNSKTVRIFPSTTAALNPQTIRVSPSPQIVKSSFCKPASLHAFSRRIGGSMIGSVVSTHVLCARQRRRQMTKPKISESKRRTPSASRAPSSPARRGISARCLPATRAGSTTSTAAHTHCNKIDKEMKANRRVSTAMYKRRTAPRATHPIGSSARSNSPNRAPISANAGHTGTLSSSSFSCTVRYPVSPAKYTFIPGAAAAAEESWAPGTSSTAHEAHSVCHRS